MSTIYDISHPLEASIAVWPGDTPYEFQPGWRIARGDSVNVGAVTMSVHTGTHTDAPFHFDDAGAPVEQLDLAPFLGPARVVGVEGRDPIRVADLEAVDLTVAPRLLLRTGAWPDSSRFPDAIPTLAPDVPDFLRERGVVLVGLDVPSVDYLDSKTLPIHHALAARNIRILESLRLDDVPDGVYELIALPLKLVGADGSPVRAVLRHIVSVP